MHAFQPFLCALSRNCEVTSHHIYFEKQAHRVLSVAFFCCVNPLRKVMEKIPSRKRVATHLLQYCNVVFLSCNIGSGSQFVHKTIWWLSILFYHNKTLHATKLVFVECSYQSFVRMSIFIFMKREQGIFFTL